MSEWKVLKGEHVCALWNDKIYYVKEPIVRCRDCKYYLHSNEKCELLDTRLRFYVTHNIWSGDAFCAWGEKRTKLDDARNVQ